MRIDVKRFALLKQQLEAEQEVLSARLARLQAVLGQPVTGRPQPIVAAPESIPSRCARVTNGGPLTMRDAIRRATERQALSVSDLVGAMKDLGYKFTSKNPKNSVGAYLYSASGKQHFRNRGGKFEAK